MAVAEVAAAAEVVAAVAAAGDSQPELPSDLLDWFTGFLCLPDTRLNREGPVCPHLPATLREGLLRTEFLDLAPTETQTTVASHLLERGRRFAESLGENDDSCLALVVSGLQKHQYRYLLEGAFWSVRARVLDLGLAFGCFHPYYNRHSRLNTEFFTMRSPTPFIGYRRLLPTDHRSLQDSPEGLAIFDRFYPGVRDALSASD